MRSACGNGPSSDRNTLRFFGENYGFAYQIRDDILDVETSKNDVQPDVDNFRFTLPIIHVYENAGKENRALLEGLLRQKQKNPRCLFSKS